MRKYLFTSESVTEGHPDKVCDQISDNVLDALLKKDPNARVACETFAAKNLILVGGEITAKEYVDIAEIVRNTLKNIGYTDPSFGIDPDHCKIITSITEQSSNIAGGVDATKGFEKDSGEQGAGDQGLMFGYACNETDELMPLPISLAHKLAIQLTKVRKENILSWVRPDGKTQVTVEYENGIPTKVDTVVISTQHDPKISNDQIEKEIKKYVIEPICKGYLTENTKYFINPSGCFAIGGPEADTGLTGRKIIVDTYGGTGRHGGGAFSGKDSSKVDRSGAYMARHIAKNIVAANLATKCEVQIAYAIGVAEPVSIFVNTFGTSIVDETEIEKAIRKVFPLKPAQIIEYLDLKKPVFAATAAYGHFGREEFSWEKTNKVEELKQALNLISQATVVKEISL
ncbi:MAG: methionine adenosyltransferase [bacterium]